MLNRRLVHPLQCWCKILQSPILFELIFYLDMDVMIWECDPAGMSLPPYFVFGLNSPAALDPLRKPPEMHSLIENFCLGTCRLEIFGCMSSR